MSFHPLFNIEDMMISHEDEEKLSVFAVSSSQTAKLFAVPLSDVLVSMKGHGEVKCFCYRGTD